MCMYVNLSRGLSLTGGDEGGDQGQKPERDGTVVQLLEAEVVGINCCRTGFVYFIFICVTCL